MKKRNSICPACLSHGWKVVENDGGSQIVACECGRFDSHFSAMLNARRVGILCDDLGYISKPENWDENEVFMISPYKEEDVWMFDDPLRGLRREPFVLDINTMIDHLVEGLTKPELGFHLFFASHGIPKTEHRVLRLDKVDELVTNKKVANELDMALSESSNEQTHCGAFYKCDEMGGVVGWLCPALLRYFRFPPEQIFGVGMQMNKKHQRTEQKPKQGKKLTVDQWKESVAHETV